MKKKRNQKERLAPGTVEEKVYCRYKGEHRQSQRYLRGQSEHDHSELGHMREREGQKGEEALTKKDGLEQEIGQETAIAKLGE